MRLGSWERQGLETTGQVVLETQRGYFNFFFFFYIFFLLFLFIHILLYFILTFYLFIYICIYHIFSFLFYHLFEKKHEYIYTVHTQPQPTSTPKLYKEVYSLGIKPLNQVL